MFKRSITTLLVALAAFSGNAIAAPLSSDTAISVIGYVQASGGGNIADTTSLNFDVGSTTNGILGLVGYGGGYGAFTDMVCVGECGTIKSISNLAVGAIDISNFITLQDGTNGNPINFSINNITNIDRSNPDYLDVSATGFIDYKGYDQTPASFLFSTQASNLTSYSATLQAQAIATNPGGDTGTTVPEPASIALLGMGLIGTGMLGVRKRKIG